MKTKVFFILLIVSFPIFLFGQKLEGIVKDVNSKPIVGANIYNLATGKHSHTNLNGEFLLESVSPGDTLEITSLGFTKKTRVVENTESPITIRLEDKLFSLDQIVISPSIDALNLLTEVNTQLTPVSSSQEVLMEVPGIFIGQHAGGGKAEQIFLRGFDLDHGTDINLTVDGLPVNMVSHAHGQGYSDLHFLIPETVEKIGFGKGPYYADQGNFGTAGYVSFDTYERLDNSIIKLEAGQFNTFRLLSMLNVLNKEKNSAYVAGEFISTDGPFESDQNFGRINLMGKYTSRLTNKDRVSILISYFTSKWDASGQIPVRAVNDGSISRFGAIDDTEGGNTSRTNLLLTYNKVFNETSSVKSSAFYSHYDFELYSNFTFFLNDSVNGDQIKQKENRQIFGVNSEFTKRILRSGLDADLKVGVSVRNDKSLDNELSRTANRTETLERLQFGDINEMNAAAYVDLIFNFNRWTINPSVRFDYFNFEYNDNLLPTYATQSESQSIVSPKINFLYNQSDELQLYLKLGKGFHSNDTRVVVARNANQILPAAYGADAGFIWKPLSKMIINLAYWRLFLEQEFVYVGDEGIVEPSGKTDRQGVDLSFRYQLLEWLFWDVDVTYSRARAIEEMESEQFIPLAPNVTLTSGLNVIHKSGVYTGLNLKFLGDRPANESNTIVAEGYTVLNLNAGYEWRGLNFGFQIQNLLDTEWNETQFATTSKLKDENNPVTEIHFTPGTPFFIKGILSYKF